MRSPETELYKVKIEVSLDGRQIFYLFFGGAVIASLVFVLGVMVGKRVEARAHVDESASTSASLDPLAALDQLAGDTDENLKFRGALSGSTEPLGKVDDSLEIAAAGLAAADAQVEAAESLTKEIKTGQRVEAQKLAEQQAAAKAEQEKRAQQAKAAEEAAAAKAAEDEKKSTKFTLQLSSFKDSAEADAFFEKVKSAGYAPYIVEANVDNKGTWFRVRLGGYSNYDDAVTAKAKFEADQKIIAYVTRVK